MTYVYELICFGGEAIANASLFLVLIKQNLLLHSVVANRVSTLMILTLFSIERFPPMIEYYPDNQAQWLDLSEVRTQSLTHSHTAECLTLPSLSHTHAGTHISYTHAQLRDDSLSRMTLNVTLLSQQWSD